MCVVVVDVAQSAFGDRLLRLSVEVYYLMVNPVVVVARAVVQRMFPRQIEMACGRLALTYITADHHVWITTVYLLAV